MSGTLPAAHAAPAAAASGLRLREVRPDDARLLLDWRTKPRITRLSNTDIAYDLDAQARWLESCYHRPDYYHWIVEVGGTPVGSVNLGGYDAAARSTSWGFCIGSDEHLGLGALIPPCFYNFAFTALGVDRVQAECFYSNTAVIDLHRRHGYRFTPAADRVIEKHRQQVLLVAMQLDKADWDLVRYQRFSAEFPVAHWTARPAHLALPASPLASSADLASAATPISAPAP